MKINANTLHAHEIDVVVDGRRLRNVVIVDTDTRTITRIMPDHSFYASDEDFYIIGHTPEAVAYFTAQGVDITLVTTDVPPNEPHDD